MDKETLNQLTKVNTKPENREILLSRLQQDPNFFYQLLSYIKDENPQASHAARAIELASLENTSLITPHVDILINIGENTTNHSIIRAVAKLLEVLSCTKLSLNFTPLQANKITEICFDWLIGNYKTAAKVYSMNILFYLGKNEAWIYPELTAILKQQLPNNSKGFKARARKIIHTIERTTS